MTIQMYLPGMETPAEYHKFKDKLIYSDIDQFSLSAFYKKEFPHVAKITKAQCKYGLLAKQHCGCVGCALQHQGIDTILHLTNGKKILFDEKKRSRDYGDILLEEYSKYDERKVGWIGGSKQTDYITYIIQPTKKVYFLPFLLLQRAWLQNYHEWIKRYNRKFATNKNYRTSNIPIPIDVLYKALFVHANLK